MSLRILFICTGNTCRSPMAEGWLSHFLPASKKGHFSISSAGLAAQPGLPPSPLAVDVMREKGVDISSHRSILANEEAIQEADLILTMSSLQKRMLEERFFLAAGKKSHLLSEYADRQGAPEEIGDPLGGDAAAYRAARDRIEHFVRKIAGKM